MLVLITTKRYDFFSPNGCWLPSLNQCWLLGTKCKKITKRNNKLRPHKLCSSGCFATTFKCFQGHSLQNNNSMTCLCGCSLPKERHFHCVPYSVPNTASWCVTTGHSSDYFHTTLLLLCVFLFIYWESLK